jgi:hypothetical protein
MGAAYQALGPELPQAMRALPCVPRRLMPRKRLSPKEPALSAASGANRGGEAKESTA